MDDVERRTIENDVGAFFCGVNFYVEAVEILQYRVCGVMQFAQAYLLKFRRPRPEKGIIEGGDPVSLFERRWIPAFAGMTSKNNAPRSSTGAPLGGIEDGIHDIGVAGAATQMAG